MNTEFRREFQHQYMVLSGEDIQENPESYEYGMLKYNHIPGLLPVSVHHMDGQCLFYYDVTGLLPLKTLLAEEKADSGIYTVILSGLAGLMDCMEEYLLRLDSLEAAPECLFLDSSRKQLYLACCPSSDSSFSESLLQTAAYLLGKLDHRSKEAVLYGYQFYQGCSEKRITSEFLRQLLYQPKAENEKQQDRENGTSDRTEGETTDRSSAKSYSGDSKEKRPASDALALLFELPPEEEKTAGRRERTKEKKEKKEKKENREKKRLFPFRRKKEKRHKESTVVTESLSDREEDFAVLFPELAETLPEKKNTRSRPSAAEEPEKTDAFAGTKAASKQEPETDSYRTVLLNNPYTKEPKVRAWLIPSEMFKEDSHGLIEDEYLVGKEKAGADICLDSPGVSRIHARIVWMDDAYFVSDLSSVNGTFLNGEKLESGVAHMLRPQDELTFGDSAFRYCPAEEK